MYLDVEVMHSMDMLGYQNYINELIDGKVIVVFVNLAIKVNCGSERIPTRNNNEVNNLHEGKKSLWLN